MTPRFSLVCVAALVAWPSRAAAQEVRTFDVVYGAPEGCPESSEFVTEVLARTHRARASTDAPEFRFTLRISDTPDGLRGVLTVRRPEGGDERRDVPGDDCSSVVRAAALIAALALDPLASATSLAPTTTGENAPAERGPPVSPAPAPPAPASPVVETTKPRPESDERGGRAPVRPRPRRWHFALAVAPTLTGAVAPALSPGASLGIRAADETGSPVAPLFGIDGEFASSSADANGVGTAVFTWLAVRLWGCPVRWPIEHGPVVFRPCAFFDAGILEAVGENTFKAQQQTAPWLAFGALGRAEWAATTNVALELHFGAVAPIRRDRYLFLPDVVVHDVPNLGLLAGLGAVFWVL